MADLAGTATFSRDHAGLIHDEAGVLRLPGAAPLTATRRYLWRPAPGGIAVHFATGVPFHTFDPVARQPGARHDCAPDLYVVRYDFTGWPDWRVTWTVSGPRKDYNSTTAYRR